VVGGLRDCEPEDFGLADGCGRVKRSDGGSQLELEPKDFALDDW